MLTNSLFPNGLRPVMRNTSGANCMHFPQRILAGVAGAIWAYDVVTKADTGITTFTTAGTDRTAGVSMAYRVGGVATDNHPCLVDKDAIYEAQIVGGTPLAAWEGINLNLKIDNVRQPAHTEGRISAHSVDGTTAANTAGLDCRMRGFVREDTNVVAANARVYVVLARHWENVITIAGV